MTRLEKILYIRSQWDDLVEYVTTLNKHVQRMQPMVGELSTLFDQSGTWEAVAEIVGVQNRREWAGFAYHPDAKKALFAQLSTDEWAEVATAPKGNQLRLVIAFSGARSEALLYHEYVNGQITEEQVFEAKGASQ